MRVKKCTEEQMISVWILYKHLNKYCDIRCKKMSFSLSMGPIAFLAKSFLSGVSFSCYKTLLAKYCISLKNKFITLKYINEQLLLSSLLRCEYCAH